MLHKIKYLIRKYWQLFLIMKKVLNKEIFYVVLRFFDIHTLGSQLGFSSEIKVPQLGSARNLHSSARLELENSGSGSSQLPSDFSFILSRLLSRAQLLYEAPIAKILVHKNFGLI